VAELADALASGFCAPYLPKRNNAFQSFQRLYKLIVTLRVKTSRLLPILFNGEVTDKLKKKAGCIALVFFVLCQPAIPQEHRAFTVPFRTVNGMILLDGQINGKPVSLLLDTGANNSVVDYRAAGFDSLKLDALRSTGSVGAEGACIVREVKLSLEHRSWFGRRVCVMNLSDASKRMGTQIDGFIGADLLATFSAVRIDYKAQTVTLD
jgi:hypothetical protein